MSRFALLVLPLLFVTAVVLSIAGPRAAGQAAEPEPFDGKVLAITCRAHPESGTVLEGVRLRKLADQSFLVGKGVGFGGPEEWQKGRTVWVAVSDISQIV